MVHTFPIHHILCHKNSARQTLGFGWRLWRKQIAFGPYDDVIGWHLWATRASTRLNGEAARSRFVQPFRILAGPTIWKKILQVPVCSPILSSQDFMADENFCWRRNFNRYRYFRAHCLDLEHAYIRDSGIRGSSFLSSFVLSSSNCTYFDMFLPVVTRCAFSFPASTARTSKLQELLARSTRVDRTIP